MLNSIYIPFLCQIEETQVNMEKERRAKECSNCGKSVNKKPRQKRSMVVR